MWFFLLDVMFVGGNHTVTYTDLFTLLLYCMESHSLAILLLMYFFAVFGFYE